MIDDIFNDDHLVIWLCWYMIICFLVYVCYSMKKHTFHEMTAAEVEALRREALEDVLGAIESAMRARGLERRIEYMTRTYTLMSTWNLTSETVLTELTKRDPVLAKQLRSEGF